MSSFAIYLGEERSYSPIASRGVSGSEIIDKKQLAISNWHLAGQTREPLTAKEHKGAQPKANLG